MSEEHDNIYDEFPTGAPHPADGVSPTARSGNRPAAGARHVSPGEVFTQDFEGSANAGDFLGLDLEFTDAVPPGGEELGGMAPHAAAEETAAQAYQAPSYDVPATDGYEDEYAEEGFADEDDESLFELPEEESSGGGAKRLVMLTLTIMLVAVAGVTLGKRFLSTEDALPPRVATGPRTAPATDPATDGETDPAATTGGPEAAATDPETVDPTTDPNTDAGTDRLVDDGLLTGTEPETGADGVEPFAGLLGDPTLTGGETGTGDDPGLLDGLSDPIAELLGGGDPAAGGTQEFPDLGSEDYVWTRVPEDMLDMVWRGPDVPREAIFAPTRTLMPKVGYVRTHMTSGEIFEGRLYAVGEGSVWIDAEPGRIGLDGELVDRFEHIVVEAGAPIGSGIQASGRRVRVRAPGGPIYGRVLSETEDWMTLAQDDGGKITIEDPEVEALGTNRPRVVSR